MLTTNRIAILAGYGPYAKYGKYCRSLARNGNSEAALNVERWSIFSFFKKKNTGYTPPPGGVAADNPPEGGIPDSETELSLQFSNGVGHLPRPTGSFKVGAHFRRAYR